jgi:RNA polymerase sigma factor (TIGR02999 family)
LLQTLSCPGVEKVDLFSAGKVSPTEDKPSVDDLFSLVYEELRRLARAVRHHEMHATVNSTALLHEAWMKLRDSPSMAAKSPEHFKAIAARAMRQVLVDEARRRGARKRGGAGEVSFVPFNEAADHESAETGALQDEELLALHAALDELGTRSARQAQMVECRFFLGMNVTDTAAVLGVSESVVERDWRATKAWLGSRVRPGKG